MSLTRTIVQAELPRLVNGLGTFSILWKETNVIDALYLLHIQREYYFQIKRQWQWPYLVRLLYFMLRSMTNAMVFLCCFSMNAQTKLRSSRPGKLKNILSQFQFVCVWCRAKRNECNFEMTLANVTWIFMFVEEKIKVSLVTRYLVALLVICSFCWYRGCFRCYSSDFYWTEWTEASLICPCNYGKLLWVTIEINLTNIDTISPPLLDKYLISTPFSFAIRRISVDRIRLNFCLNSVDIEMMWKVANLPLSIISHKYYESLWFDGWINSI